jgi:uncharacterized membrane-anchored protein YhcB (DUF1043 family)
MAETEAVVVAPMEGDTYTKDYVEDLKKQLSKSNEERQSLKAKFAAHEENQREELKAMQPTVQEWVKEGLEIAGDKKAELRSMQAFADSLHTAQNLDSAMPFAKIITAHSANLKRVREEFAVAKGSADELSRVNKELDTVKEELNGKIARVAELENLCKEYQDGLEKTTLALTKAGLVQSREEHNFSLAKSREEASGSSDAAPQAMPAGSAIDPLAEFVSKHSAGGNRRIFGVGAESSFEGALSAM